MADEPVKTIDDAFDGVQGGQSNIEPGASDEPADKTEKTWSEMGLPEDFNGMDRTAMAQRVKEALYREKQWGTQGTEIGTLRTRNKELEDSIRSALGDKPADAIEDMSAGQQSDFWKTFEANPQKAIADVMKPQIRNDEKLETFVGDVVNKILQQYDTYNSETRFKEGHEDWNDHDDYVQFLRKDEHFGGERSYAELQKFARLFAENKSLADLVYTEMKAHPTMSFERSKKIAELELGAKALAQTTEEKLAAQVGKVAPTAAGGKGQKSTTEVIKNLDDAFDNA